MSIEDKLLGAAAGGGGITPSDNFTTVTWTGDAVDDRAITAGFQPDMVWFKTTNQSNDHNLSDSTRGATYQVRPNSTNTEGNATDLIKSFTSTGFTLGTGGDANASGNTYVAWCFKANGGTTASNGDGSITSTVQANANAGFSIVKYTGTGADITVGHGVGATLDLLIIKGLGTTNDWAVLHTDGTDNNFLQLNSSAAESGDGSVFGSTFARPTATVFTVGNTGESGTSGQDYIAYCFASISGFSKFGSYTGNGSDFGPIVETGFEVGYLMVKRTDSAGSWFIFDNARNTTNPRDKYLLANGSNVEATDLNGVDFLSNGFQMLDDYADQNADGGTFIYMAFATDPDTEQPTLADSFNINTYAGSGVERSFTGTGFSPGMVWWKSLDIGNHNIGDVVQAAGNFIRPNSTIAQYAATDQILSYDSDGYTIGTGNDGNQTGRDWISWIWKSNDDVPTGLGGPQRAVYKFEDNVTDVTGNFAATANSITYAAGKFNQAAVFNGSTGDIDLHGDIELTTMAVSLWVYLDNNAPTSEVIIEFDNGYGLNFPSAASGKLAAQWGNSNANHTLSNAALSDSQWYNVVANFRSGATDLYIDGVKQTTGGTAADYLTADENTIGSRRTGEFLDGMVDQVRIFPYNIGQTQVTELYNETTADNDDVSYGSKLMATASVNANAGFSIVQFMTPASPGANTRIPHGLSAVPEMIILKRTDGVEDWYVYHTSMGTGQFMRLNTTAIEGTATNLFNTVNATVFNPSWTGTGNQEAIAYCFHAVTGYSKFGTYTGTGATGNVVTVGFQPDYVMVKSTDEAEPWFILDSARDPSNPRDNRLMADSDAAESDGSVHTMDFNATDFTLDGTVGNGTNGSGKTYIYMAFKENPVQYPISSGEMGFLTIAGGASGANSGAGGGAGGLRTTYGTTSGGGASAETNLTLAAGTYTITVGAGGVSRGGGSSVPAYGGQGISGSVSTITGTASVSTVGGGGGGSNSSADAPPISSAGVDGGSGGGMGPIHAGGETPGSGTANEGFAGGSSFYGSPWTSGGGGGAGSVGADRVGGQAGDGGAGLTISITGGSRGYAGGGGGSAGTATLFGRGTAGGGNGAPTSSTTGFDGTANTGGGGGGGGDTQAAGSGGSGIVVLRLLTADYSGSTTGSPTITTDGDETILKYTGSGTYVHS